MGEGSVAFVLRTAIFIGIPAQAGQGARGARRAAKIPQTLLARPGTHYNAESEFWFFRFRDNLPPHRDLR